MVTKNFTHTFGQISPVIPYVFTAPFYFARKIELGVMTQTAGAFGHVASAVTFLVNYYTYLAGSKSVVDRLNSFDAAIDQAEALRDVGPKRVASAGSAPRIDFEDVELFLPDGRCAVEMEHLALAASESVCLLAHHDISLAAEFGRYRGIADSGQPNDL